MALNARKAAAPVATNKITTAELLRGRVYYFENEAFEKNVVREVTEDMGTKLEELFEVTTDSEGEDFEKPTFEVLYDQDPIEEIVPEPRSTSKRAQHALQTSAKPAQRATSPAPARAPVRLPVRLPPRR